MISISVHGSDEIDNEYILQLRNNGNFIFSEGLLVVEKNNQYYFSVVELFDALGIYYDINEHGLMAGFIRDKSNTFEFNKKELILKKGSSQKNLVDSDLLEVEGTSHLHSRVLENLLDVKFNFFLLKSIIAIETQYKFPPELKEQRSKKHLNQVSLYQGEEVVNIKREWLDGFHFDQKITYRSSDSRSTDSRTDSIFHQSATSFEFLKSEFYGSLVGENSRTKSTWLTLERNDYRGRIFGDLGASTLSLYNFRSNNLRLLGNSHDLRGMYISSKPFHESILFSTENFSGVLRTGWEVELYHNGILIGRQSGEASKDRYNFENIELYYGNNKLHFVFYGPRGEVIHEYKNYDITNIFKNSKGVNWTFFSGLDDEGDLQHFVSTDFLIAKSLFSELFIKKEIEKDYYGINLSTFFNGNVLSIYNITDGFGGASELTTRFKLFDINFNLSQAIVHEFISDALSYGTKEVNAITSGTILTSLFKNYNINLMSQFKYFDTDDIDALQLRHRITHSRQNYYLSIQLEKERSRRDFELFYRYNIKNWQFKTTLNFNESEIDNGIIEKKYKDSFKSFGVGLRQNFLTDMTEGFVNVERKFKYFSIGAQLLHGESKSEVLLDLSYGIIASKDHVSLHSEPTSRFGNVKVISYLDYNDNGKIDYDELAVEKVGFRKVSTSRDIETNKDGEVFFNHLAPHRPVDIKATTRNIDNVFYRLKKTGVRVWPRPGKTSVVYFPLVIRGEIEGEVNYNKELVKYSDLTIILRDEQGKALKTSKLESDGYFWLDDISAGNYLLDIECFKCSKKMTRRSFNMPAQGDSLFFKESML